MNDEVLLALFTKVVEAKLAQLPQATHGPRGFRGAPGQSFVWEDHADTIHGWVKDAALKFEDLTDDQRELIRGETGRIGRDGRDGRDGQDGKSFSFEEHSPEISNALLEIFNERKEDLKLRFTDLSAEDIGQLRGPRGNDGKNGKFVFDEHREEIQSLITSFISEMKPDLKLKLSDLTDEDRDALRGPRGQRGKRGEGFNFEEQRENILTLVKPLVPKFEDFSEDEVSRLKLKFTDLSDEERDSLKLKFSDISDEDRKLIRGFRGQRGRNGQDGNSSKWEVGSGPPTIASANVGDMYLDSITGDVYQWE